ncbi:MAG: tRNA threonylcarbamoyladenosine dehydratase, partial [Desulfotignum sp.]
LHRRGVFTGIWCVYSLEPPVLSPDAHALPDEGAQDPGNGTGHGRKRPAIGTIPWIPGIFGLTLAAEAVHIITR